MEIIAISLVVLLLVQSACMATQHKLVKAQREYIKELCDMRDALLSEPSPDSNSIFTLKKDNFSDGQYRIAFSSGDGWCGDPLGNLYGHEVALKKQLEK